MHMDLKIKRKNAWQRQFWLLPTPKLWKKSWRCSMIQLGEMWPTAPTLFYKNLYLFTHMLSEKSMETFLLEAMPGSTQDFVRKSSVYL